MAQPPFLVDALQIEPGSGDTLTVTRDSTDGYMKFVDPGVPSGILLPDLSGIRNITGVFVVGRAGTGAPYTSVQAAFDAIPDSSSAVAPSVVMVTAGVYQENLVLQKDGVHIFGIGQPTFLNDGASDTLEVSASLDVTPLQFKMRGVTVENSEAGAACIRLLGADSFATGDITVVTAPLVAGDTITIGGTVLTGVSGVRTSGSDDFSVTGGTATALAAEIAAAINDEDNSFAETVLATPALGIITLDAVTAGSGGNAITLAVSTTPGGGLTVSGVVLSGGGADGSMVASQGFELTDCTVVASGVGTYQIVADTINYLTVRGGTWRGSSSTSNCTAANLALFRVFGVDWVNNLGLSYDSALETPAALGTEYDFRSVGRMGDVITSLEGDGALHLAYCSEVGDLTVGGDQQFDISFCHVADVTISGTTAGVSRHTTREGLSLASGTPTFSEDLTGASVFVAVDTADVVFEVPQGDDSYRVLLESPSTAVILAVDSKTAEGFTINASGVLSGTVGYSVVRS